MLEINSNNIFKEAEKGNILCLESPLVDKMHDYEDTSRGCDHNPLQSGFDLCGDCLDCSGATPLHILAELGVTEAIHHKSSGTVEDNFGMTPLHYFACSDSPKIQKEDCLNCPGLDVAQETIDGDTALHTLAQCGYKFVLNHPSVSTVRNYHEETPLHHLADYPFPQHIGIGDILDHKDIDKVFDKFGRTPLHNLIRDKKVHKQYIEKKYPWFKFDKRRKLDEVLLNEILKTSNAEKFISGLLP